MFSKDRKKLILIHKPDSDAIGMAECDSIGINHNADLTSTWTFFIFLLLLLLFSLLFVHKHTKQKSFRV